MNQSKGQIMAMDRLASTIASQDNAPFSRPLDTTQFIPAHAEEGSSGIYKPVRTGGEGIASSSQFLGTTPEPYQANVHQALQRAGNYLLDMPVLNAVHERGYIVGTPFMTIRQTPNSFIPGQTTGRPGETRRFNPSTHAFHTFISSLWLELTYPTDGEIATIYTALFRFARQPKTDVVRELPVAPLIFGEEAIEMALRATTRKFGSK